ncbi:unnamed protein product [Umbelopsis ramanniana]
MSYPQGENSSYQGYQQAPAPHGHSGGFTAPQQPHQDAQTIYGQGQNPGSWQHGQFNEATEYASRETGNDPSMFSSLLSSVLSGQQQHEQAQPHEIEHARAAQQKVYGGDRGNQPIHDDDIASAAAMHAVERSGSSDSGGLQSVIGMAMSEVTKLMGKSGGSTGAQQGSSSGGQSDMIKKAISMAIKLYASKQAGSAAGQAAGGSSSSSSNPLGSMMGMFMGGGSKPSSTQGGGYSQPPPQHSNASGYAPPPSHQSGAPSYSNPPQNQGHSGYNQPPSYSGHQQSGYEQQQAPYGQQQQAPYGQQQHAPYGQQQQAPYGQQQQAPYEQQQQQQQGGSGGSGFEAVAANLLNKFLK